MAFRPGIKSIVEFKMAIYVTPLTKLSLSDFGNGHCIVNKVDDPAIKWIISLVSLDFRVRLRTVPLRARSDHCIASAHSITEWSRCAFNVHCFADFEFNSGGFVSNVCFIVSSFAF